MANLKVSEQAYPSTRYTEAAAPATPATGEVIIYAKADGSLYQKDDAGTETALAGGAGDITTDVAWAAKGDLIVGTGNNTAAILTVGSNDKIPMADSGQSTGIKWVASQTPSTQAFGDAAAEGTADTYARGDHKHAMPANPVGATGARLPVQTASIASASGTTRAPVFPATPTNGNLLFMLTLAEGTTSVSGISQTNVTWTNLAIASAGVNPVIELWKGVVSASAGTTATVTWSGTEFHCAVGLEFSGLTGTLSNSATRHVTTDSTGNHPSPVLTPSNVTDLILAAVSSASNGTTFSSASGLGLAFVENGRTLAVAWGFPGSLAAYAVFIGGASATASGLIASIA